MTQKGMPVAIVYGTNPDDMRAAAAQLQGEKWQAYTRDANAFVAGDIEAANAIYFVNRGPAIDRVKEAYQEYADLTGTEFNMQDVVDEEREAEYEKAREEQDKEAEEIRSSGESRSKVMARRGIQTGFSQADEDRRRDESELAARLARHAEAADALGPNVGLTDNRSATTFSPDTQEIMAGLGQDENEDDDKRTAAARRRARLRVSPPGRFAAAAASQNTIARRHRGQGPDRPVSGDEKTDMPGEVQTPRGATGTEGGNVEGSGGSDSSGSPPDTGEQPPGDQKSTPQG